MMAGLILITTTSDSRSILESIAVQLLDSHLVACVQISGPVTSHYRWEGKTTHATEHVLTAKTRHDLFSAVEAMIRSSHNYQLPEIIATPIETSPDYGQWLQDETRRQPPPHPTAS
ncbi:MAG: divalent-cation tolerance protein CutA [Planctomycetaceae bacterium]|nr:divalent-cation tolerance protein CutA [Planctomycetaceae bacterium]